MNDRFKFRVWDKKHNCYHTSDNWFIDRDGQLWFKGSIFESGSNEDFTIEQCTGSKDKNGKLIFEGDVIADGFEKAIVTWDGDHCILEYDDGGVGEFAIWVKTFEIIGNIHETGVEKNEP